jgi:O-antigen/teichoic acid export membrane protein
VGAPIMSIDRRSAEWDLASGVNNYAALVLGQAGGALLSFWALAIVSRSLEPAGYGSVVAVLAVSQAVAQFGLHWSVLSLYRHGCEEFVATGRLASSFWTRLAILGASGALVALAWPLGSRPLLGWLGLPREALWLVPLHVASSALSFHVHYALLAAKEPRFQSAAFVGSRAVLVGLLLSVPDLTWRVTILLYAFVPLLEALVGLARLRRLIVPGVSVDGRLARAMIGFSLPLVLTGILGYLATNHLDAFFILKLRSPRELGLYSLAYQLAGSFMQLATIAGSLLLSLFVTFGVEGTSDRTDHYFRELLPVLCLLWSGACLLLSAAGSALIPPVFGASFAESSALLWPLGAAAALAGPVFLGFGPLIHARSVTRVSAWLATGSASTNVVLNAVLIPRFGLAGCAWATAAAYGVGTVVAVVLTGRLVGLSGRRLRWYLLPAVPPLLAAALAPHGGPLAASALGIAALLVLGVSSRASFPGGFLRITRLAVTGPAGSNG